MPESSDRTLIERGWRYTFVGLFCALTNNVIMIGTDLLGGHYLLGVFLAFATVMPSAYVVHSWFTFGRALNWGAFSRFAASVAAAYPITLLIMVILCSGLRLPVLIAAPTSTILLFVLNFAAAHWAILSRRHSDPAVCLGNNTGSPQQNEMRG